MVAALFNWLDSVWRRFIPFTAWMGELKDKETLRADIIAGITVALVLVPQSMAYAQLARIRTRGSTAGRASADTN